MNLSKQGLVKIPIIVPIYNVEGYLSRCIDRILSQSFKNCELISVYDGSLDNCRAICDGNAAKSGNLGWWYKVEVYLSLVKRTILSIIER